MSLLVAICVFSFGGCSLSKKAPPREEAPMVELAPDLAKAFEVSDTKGSGPSKQSIPSLVVEQGKNEGSSTSPAKSSSTAKRPKGKSKPGVVEVPPSAKGNAFVIARRRPQRSPFRLGEKVTLDVQYLKTTAGEMTFEIEPYKYVDARKVYHFVATAQTTSIFAHIYRAYEKVESFVDHIGFFPYRFVLTGDESKHKRGHLELFDHAHGQQYVSIRDDRLNGDVHETKGFRDLSPLSQDGLSAMFYLRTLEIEEDKPAFFSSTNGGHLAEVKAELVKREEIRTPAGSFSTKKIQFEVKFKDKTYNDSYVWLTDDDRRFIVKFEAKVRIGWLGGVARTIELGEQPDEE